MIAPGNDRKRPLRRRFAEQRLCRVLDGVVAPRADGDPRWLGGLGQGKGQFQHAMVAVGGDVSRRRRWSGYSTTKDESWTAKVPCCRFCPCGSASEFGERERASVSVFSRHVPDPSVIVALEGTGRGGCCSREPRRPAGGGLGTAKCVASTARKSCPPAPPIAAMCWAACRRARSRLRGQSVSPPPRRWTGGFRSATTTAEVDGKPRASMLTATARRWVPIDRPKSSGPLSSEDLSAGDARGALRPSGFWMGVTVASAFPGPQRSRSRRYSRFGDSEPCCPRTSASREPM